MNELAQPANSAVSIIQSALANNVDPATLRELLSVRREWEADESRKSYYVAISEFQRRAPIIAKSDDAHGKKYAALDTIWGTVKPLLTELGLSVTWQLCELRDAVCHLEGEIAHISGHGIRITYDVPLPEMIRGQNAAQQLGSAYTYGKRYAICGALGLVTGEFDDDGNAAGTAYVTKEQADELAAILATLADRETALKDLLAYGQCDSVSDLPAAKFIPCRKALLTKPKK